MLNVTAVIRYRDELQYWRYVTAIAVVVVVVAVVVCCWW